MITKVQLLFGNKDLGDEGRIFFFFNFYRSPLKRNEFKALQNASNYYNINRSKRKLEEGNEHAFTSFGRKLKL